MPLFHHNVRVYTVFSIMGAILSPFKLAGRSVGDPGVFIAGELSFFLKKNLIQVFFPSVPLCPHHFSWQLLYIWYLSF